MHFKITLPLLSNSKEGKPEESTAEKRFLEALVNCCIGLETTIGCGCVGVESIKKTHHEPV